MTQAGGGSSSADSALTLVEAIAALRAQGYPEDFCVVSGPGGRVRCGHCQVDLGAAELETGVVLRVEGESDPADSALVAGVGCPACGTSGVLVAMYGPAADGADADVVAALAGAPPG